MRYADPYPVDVCSVCGLVACDHRCEKRIETSEKSRKQG